MTRWKSITVETRREAVDALSHFFTEHGSLGMAYDERLFGTEGDPADPLPPPDEVTKLTAYFPWEADLHSVKRDFLDFLPLLAESFGAEPGTFLSAAEITDFGWAEKWKENFKPSRIGKRITVKPSWEPYSPSPEEVVVTIDPGQAFGTGTHETTQMCLQFLEEAFDGTPTPRRVLDVGTGTGILGIAAALLGAPLTLGIDVDPLGVEVAGENARVNGVEDRFHAATTPLSCVEGRYDLILANVLAEILSDLKQEIADRLEPGGKLILSGIISEKGDWVAKEYEAAGFRLAGRKEDGQWTALLLRREGDVA
ncbi:MAG: 50S ribosomal protein L11 methyltransferase [Deltaproteobacteria bacterium]|jgi:ribosomal protein L11 methyltransferase|nr:50S ribosomal protein L11 methyltransferase [Deltaproteobacteria bacterium]